MYKTQASSHEKKGSFVQSSLALMDIAVVVALSMIASRAGPAVDFEIDIVATLAAMPPPPHRRSRSSRVYNQVIAALILHRRQAICERKSLHVEGIRLLAIIVGRLMCEIGGVEVIDILMLAAELVLRWGGLPNLLARWTLFVAAIWAVLSVLALVDLSTTVFPTSTTSPKSLHSWGSRHVGCLFLLLKVFGGLRRRMANFQVVARVWTIGEGVRQV